MKLIKQSLKLISFRFTKRSFIVFVINVVAAFLMTVVPHLNVQQSWVSPLPNKVDTLQIIEPKLKQKDNNFRLTVPGIKQNFIPIVSAGQDYEEASGFGVIDLDSGEIIASKNLDKKLPIASLTKVMTAVVALDLADLDENFTVSEKAASQIPTKVALKSGESYSLDHLIKHALISSANDSAQVIKEGIDKKYGEEAFLKAMNRKAEILGMKNSMFTNPQGFDNSNHYSTVEDLSILSHYALTNYPFIAEVVGEEIIDLTNNWADRRFYLQNWNGLLGIYPGAKGLKIGNTEGSGNCTIVFAQQNGKRILSIVLGAPGVLERDLWASQLLDLGFNRVGLDAVSVTEKQLKDKYASWITFR